MGAHSLAVYARCVRPRFVLTVLLATVFAAAQKPPPGTLVSEPAGRRLDAALLAKAPLYWGAVLIAVQGEPVLAKGYGAADRRKVPNSPSSLFDLGHASLPLTSLLVLKLAADRRLSLEDPVGRHLPDWPADKATMTIGQLVDHSAGLPADADWGGGRAGASRSAAQVIGRCRLVDAPGAGRRFSPLHGIALALVAEAAAQQRFESALAERVLRPFGMQGAGLCNGHFDGKLVTARRSDKNEAGEPATQFPMHWGHRGARGVLASVLDVHALLLAATGPKAAEREQFAAAFRPIDGGEALRIDRPVVGGPQVLRIAAQGPGYRTRWLVHEPSRSWIVLCTDDRTDTGPIEQALGAELVLHLLPGGADAALKAPADQPAPEPPARPVTGPEAERFVGTYTLPDGGGRFVVAAGPAGLVLRGEGLRAAGRIDRGAWPPPDEAALLCAEDRGIAVLERLVRGDATVLAEAFASEAAAAEASTLVGDWLATGGPFVRAELLGARTVGGALCGWYRLTGARGTACVLCTWRDGDRIASARLAEPPAFAANLTIVRRDWAIARSGNGRELRLL
ncbi:MAG: beta-lactamase family protein, partial [Planctomycetes bacterium]|nr:beta-lactamase family protein [Planctomycetota bacterium]